MPKSYELEEAELEALRALSPEEKLNKLVYIDREIEKKKRDLKDIRSSTKDYIGELQAQRDALMDTIPSQTEAQALAAAAAPAVEPQEQPEGESQA